MKITIWIRPDADGCPTLRLDTKFEDRDTPVVQRYGFKLANAIEGNTSQPKKGKE